MESIEEISHIGIAVNRIESSLYFYEQILGLKLERIETITEEKVKVAFLSVGSTRIELLEPISAQSTIRKFIDRHGEGIHHIALETSNISLRIERMKKRGIRFLNEHPLPGAMGSSRAFIHPASAGGVLFELTEHKDKQ